MPCSTALNYVFRYDTNKVSIIHDKCIGFILRFFQILILVYVIGYSIMYKRGYQEFYGLSSSVLVKVKGIGVSNRKDIHRKIWDIPDTVVPPQEMNAIFITTNAIETANQSQGTCPEDSTVEDAFCQKNSDCKKGKPLHLGNGIMTGQCVKSSSGTNKTCEIKAWCPIENDTIIYKQSALLKEVPDFTVLIRNTIIFENLNVQRSNLFAWTKGIINKKCTYNASDELLKYCPIFKVSSLIGKINKTELTELLTHGGVIRVIITWNCNLDYSVDNCTPHYSFSRLYLNDGTFSKGWNFRYANYFEVNHVEYRMLYKVFGLRILIEVRGKAGKFSPATLSMNIGSGLALLSLAVVLCDILLINSCPKKNKYYQYKYEVQKQKKKDKSERLQEKEEYI